MTTEPLVIDLTAELAFTPEERARWWRRARHIIHSRTRAVARAHGIRIRPTRTRIAYRREMLRLCLAIVRGGVTSEEYLDACAKAGVPLQCE